MNYVSAVAQNCNRLLKFFIVAQFCHILISCANKELSKKQSDLTREGIRGPVSRITETSYKAVEKFGEAQKVQINTKSIHLYNEHGEKTQSAWYYPDGSLVDRFTYLHDKEGKVIEEISNYKRKKYNYNASNRLRNSIEYDTKGRQQATGKAIIDKEGRELQVINKFGTESPDTTINTFNKEGQIIKQRKNGSRGYTFTIIYDGEALDEYGNWKTRTIYDDKSQITIIEREYKYYKPK